MPDLTPTAEELARVLEDDLAFCEDIHRDLIISLAWFDTESSVQARIRYEPLAEFSKRADEGWPAAIRCALAARAANTDLVRSLNEAIEERDRWKTTCEAHRVVIGDKEAEIARLREALKPFAEYVDLRGSAMPDDTLMDSYVVYGPTLGNCRKAAEVLKS